MRMLMHVRFPIEPFNSALRDGTAGAKIQRIMDSVKPEAAYFTDEDGMRGGTFVVHVNDLSEIPALAEPFFLTFDAEVKFGIAMTAEDIGKANLDALGKKWG